MQLAERHRLQLAHEQQALIDEFTYWRNHTNGDLPYAKHRSQIYSITNTIEKFLNALPQQVSASEEPFRQHQIRLDGLLYASHIWAFFRSKFALRLIDHYEYSPRAMLRCADEFAWNCYEPVRAAARQAQTLADDALKEPPLTFFASDAGPYMAQRNALFSPEGIAGNSQTFQHFDKTLQLLPVPIIAMPWAQSTHLPAGVVIAHEMGHLVERDFGLLAPLADALQSLTTIDDARRGHWRNWLKELFADTYGLLCTGPAYLAALLDYLVAPRDVVVDESLDTETAKRYPPRTLRIAFNLAVLHHLGLPDEGIGQAWNAAYPPSSFAGYEAYQQDAMLIAARCLQTPLPALGGVPIPAVMTTTSVDWATMEQQAQALLAFTGDELPGFNAKAPQRFRTWFAAATWAYYIDPQTFMKLRIQRKLLRKLNGSILGTTRGPGQTAPETTSTRAADVLMADFLVQESVA